MNSDLQLSRASETVIPSCVAAEKSVLSCVLTEGNRGGGGESEMLGQLQCSDFHDLRNRGIYERLDSLQREGHPLNIHQLLKALNGEADEKYTRSLLLECPSPLQFPIYLKDLKETAIRRRVYGVAQTGLKLSQNPDLSPDEVYDNLQYEFRKAANLSSTGLPPALDVGEFLAKDVDVPPELIEGLLHKGTKMLISAGSKSHKTHIALDWAASVQTGTPIWGLNTIQANVMYLNFELPEFDAHRRLKNICRKKNISLPPNSGMKIWNLSGYSCDIAKLRPQLMTQMANGHYGLVIVDPIYKLFGGRDENKVSDVTEVMSELEQIIKETGAAVLFITHQSKGNQSTKESKDRYSGSGALGRDVNSALMLTDHIEEDCYTVEAPLLRSFPPLKPFGVRWEIPLMVRDDTLNPDHLKERRNPNRAKEHSVEEIMAHVPVNEPIDKNTLRDKVNMAGIALNKINPLIEQAVEEGKLYEHLIKRSGSCPKKQLARYPQELQGDLHDSHDPHA